MIDKTEHFLNTPPKHLGRSALLLLLFTVIGSAIPLFYPVTLTSTHQTAFKEDHFYLQLSADEFSHTAYLFELRQDNRLLTYELSPQDRQTTHDSVTLIITTNTSFNTKKRNIQIKRKTNIAKLIVIQITK